MKQKKCLVIINLRGKSSISYIDVMRAYHEEKRFIIKLKEDESLESRLDKISKKYCITSILVDEESERLSPQFRDDLTQFVKSHFNHDVDVMCLEQRARLVEAFSENVYSVLV